MNEERVLVYAGLTITEDEVKRAVPEAIVRPPAAQSDILSDVFKYSPTHVILIDGRFLQHLPHWHKELVYCLLDPRIGGRVYGCSSMGALRAADLADFGMIGYGRIFNWYYENVLTDDSEVAVSYHLDASGTPHVDTVALVDCRSTIEQYCPEDLDPEILLSTARRIHWTVRTEQRLRKAWVEAGFNLEVDIIPQQFLDAGHLLQNFRELPVPGPQGINETSLSQLFCAQYERERRIEYGDKSFPAEEVDAHVALTSPYGRRIFEDASNRAIAIMMCDKFGITATVEEAEYEGAEFCVLNGITDISDWCKSSHVDLQLLMISKARLKKLHRALRVRRQCRKATNGVTTPNVKNSTLRPTSHMWALR